MIRQNKYGLLILVLLGFSHICLAQQPLPPGDPIVIRIVELEYGRVKPREEDA